MTRSSIPSETALAAKRGSLFFPAMSILKGDEVVSFSILDAMAAGVPVAATAGGGIPEIVRDGETGLLAGIGDYEALGGHIVRLLREKELCARLKAGALAMIEKTHTVDRMVEGNLAVYEELLGLGASSI